MSVDENAQSMSIGSRGWLDANKGLHMRSYSYLPPEADTSTTGARVARTPKDEPDPHRKEAFDRLLEA